MQKCAHVLLWIFLVCFGLAMLAILGLSGYAAGVLFALGVFWLLRRRQIPYFTLWLFLGGFALRLLVILVLRPPVISDFLGIYNAACGLLEGDLTPMRGEYFTLWAYQTPIVLWEAFFLSIWHSIWMLKLVNCLLGAGLVCLVYRLVRPHVRPAAAQTAAVLLSFFPFSTTLPTLLSNQIPSAFFLALGLWLLACPDTDRLRFWRYPLAGLALQLGNLLRCEGVVILVAIAAWAVFTLLRRPQLAKRLLLGLLALLVVYFAVHAAVGAAIRVSGLNETGLANNNPLWKLVTGLNYDTRGSFSSADWQQIAPTLDNYRPTDETIELETSLIRERLTQPPHRLAALMIRKIDYLWNTSGLYWAFQHTQAQSGATILGLITRADAYELLQNFNQGLFLFACAFALWGLCSGAKAWGEKDPAALLPYFVVFAMFCALLVIEVQPRYAFLPQQFLFLAAAFGLDRRLEVEPHGCSAEET